MRLVYLLGLFLLFSVAADHPDCDYSSVYSACGGECSLEIPSGSCEFDQCRFCCIESECPGYFQHQCEDSAENFEGGGHCSGGSIDVCAVETLCGSAELYLSLAVLNVL